MLVDILAIDVLADKCLQRLAVESCLFSQGVDLLVAFALLIVGNVVVMV